MRTSLADIGMVLGLTDEIQAMMLVTSVEFAAQIGAEICMVVFRLPRPASDLTADRGTMQAEPSPDLGPRDVSFVEFLNLDPAIESEMAVMYGQVSAALQVVV